MKGAKGKQINAATPSTITVIVKPLQVGDRVGANVSPTVGNVVGELDIVAAADGVAVGNCVNNPAVVGLSV